MSLYSFLALAAVVIILFIYWIYRRGETVDLTSQSARSQAAATWLAQGEGEEAEHMLHTAIEVLEGWPRALARQDLANLYTACGKYEEAICELEAICEQKWQGHDSALAEIWIGRAQLLETCRTSDEALSVLSLAEQSLEEQGAKALVLEAQGLLYIGRDEDPKAIESLAAAFAKLSKTAHDRAASTWVSLAFARVRSGQAMPWSEFDDMAKELQRGALTNFSDRMPGWEEQPRQALARGVVEELENRGGWQDECRALGDSIQTD